MKRLYTVHAPRQAPDESRLRLTPKQLAARENVHYNTVLRWIACRGLPHYRGSRHGAIFIRYGEYIDWMRSGGSERSAAKEQRDV